MRNIKTFIRVLITLLCLSVVAKAGLAREPWKFDMFGRLSCSDELARLDNYSDQLAKLPDVLAVVVVYGGRNDTRRGEVVARLFAIRDHLLKKRSIDANRIVLLNGGFREKRETELWIIPTFSRESVMHLVFPGVKSDQAKLRRSVLSRWEYVCSGNQ